MLPPSYCPGTIVWSDVGCLQSSPTSPPVAEHQTVNHTTEFVNSTTGVHTQNIESYWNRVKTEIKHMRGCHDHMLSSYLDEFIMWREHHGRTASGLAALRSLCRDIALWYPVWLAPTPSSASFQSSFNSNWSFSRTIDSICWPLNFNNTHVGHAFIVTWVVTSRTVVCF